MARLGPCLARPGRHRLGVWLAPTEGNNAGLPAECGSDSQRRLAPLCGLIQGAPVPRTAPQSGSPGARRGAPPRWIEQPPARSAGRYRGFPDVFGLPSCRMTYCSTGRRSPLYFRAPRVFPSALPAAVGTAAWPGRRVWGEALPPVELPPVGVVRFPPGRFPARSSHMQAPRPPPCPPPPPRSSLVGRGVVRGTIRRGKSILYLCTSPATSQSPVAGRASPLNPAKYPPPAAPVRPPRAGRATWIRRWHACFPADPGPRTCRVQVRRPPAAGRQTVPSASAPRRPGQRLGGCRSTRFARTSPPVRQGPAAGPADGSAHRAPGRPKHGLLAGLRCAVSAGFSFPPRPAAARPSPPCRFATRVSVRAGPLSSSRRSLGEGEFFATRPARRTGGRPNSYRPAPVCRRGPIDPPFATHPVGRQSPAAGRPQPLPTEGMWY
jgi:hypothetical protein